MKRRSFIQALPFVGAAVAMPVPASKADGMHLDAETSALVANWQRLTRERKALEALIKERGLNTAAAVDHPIRGLLNVYYSDENDAQHAVTRVLRKVVAE